jgi:hypothetical protein
LKLIRLTGLTRGANPYEPAALHDADFVEERERTGTGYGYPGDCGSKDEEQQKTAKAHELETPLCCGATL